MNLLLDTHVALWLVTDSSRLSALALEMIAAEDNAVFVSAASIWEIAIKYARPKGRSDDMPLSGHQAKVAFEQAGLKVLPVTAAHAAAVDDLPPLHGDPFDRMLVAQARCEPMRLLTRDRYLADYGEAIVTV